MYGWLLLPFIAKKLPAVICLQLFWISFKCFFYSFAWHSNIMKADMEPTNTYRCLPDKAKPENVPMSDREDPACGKLSVWVTLSGSVSKKGDTGRAAFTTFYLRSNLSWSTRRSANTLCWLSPYKHMFLVCSGGLCCLGLCNVLFDKAVLISQVTWNFVLKQTMIFPNSYPVLPVPKHIHKKLNNALVTTSE